jgi:hypothetical protein
MEAFTPRLIFCNYGNQMKHRFARPWPGPR